MESNQNIIKKDQCKKDRIDVMASWSPAAFDIAIAYVDEQLKINGEKQNE